MKKGIFVLGLAGLLFSCNNNTNTAATEFKTAYIDSSKLMTEYQEVKDIESKYKIKSEEKGKEFEGEIAQFQREVQNFQTNAAQKGQAWAQQKGGELQRKEQQLQMKQQTIFQELQAESAKEMDSVVKKVKSHIADFAKKKSLDYVFNTEEASTVIYGKEEYNITEDIIKELNSKYKGSSAATTVDDKKAETPATKEEK
ncbi:MULTISPECIES: OmpH family outer membrane protein [unclassified Myroides]|uniref:OmpH family outer membrane protein n=1 Tax=unclassified Myroides TaxID=2642485 RepID=UPI003D2F7A5C